MKKIEEYVRTIPDFPEPGIMFRDVTSVLQDPDGLKLSIDSMIKLLDGVDFDIIAGAESRGFIFGMPIAYALGKAFIPVRKKGKLPCETVSAEYDLEYGKAEVQILFEPLQAAISSMELPKNFENKKLPNTLRRLAFLPFHL